VNDLTPNKPKQLTIDGRAIPLDRVECKTCAVLEQRGSFGPKHDASPRCESGKRPHCTCDTCF
jgi:hypothetical protein